MARNATAEVNMKSNFPFFLVGIVVGFLLFWALSGEILPQPREITTIDTVYSESKPLPPIVKWLPSKPVIDSAATQAALAQADSALAEAKSARELVAELLKTQTASTPFETSRDSVTVVGVMRGQYVPPLRQMMLGVEISSVRYPAITTHTEHRPPAWVGPAVGLTSFGAGLLLGEKEYLGAAACAGASILILEVYL
jgi:hypothetical protein